MIDLQRFCSKDQCRHSLTTPWVETDDCVYYTCASDGAIIIRIRGALCERKDSIAHRVIDWRARREAVVAWCPHVEFTGELRKCPWCEGAGFVMEEVECWQCEGSGAVPCECCGQDTECEVCEGSGTVDNTEKTICLRCDGVGADTKKLPVITPHGVFSAYYYNLIGGLPNVEWALERERSITTIPALFRFDGGDGAIMPLNHLLEDESAAQELREWLLKWLET